MVKVKICGITNIEDALLCTECGTDALGFIFYEKSRRFITYGKAAEIIQNLPTFVMKVGVFVNEDVNIVNNTARKAGLNAVQLHGDELPEYVDNIFHPVIKAFRVKDNFKWNIIDKYKNCNILLDSFSTNEMGGTGKSFDWKSIPEKYRNKIIISGGIAIDNLDIIFNEIKPAAIDLSSSLESSPGKKDRQKVKEFMKIFNQLRSK